ncbi:MAG: sigma-70 family RNA polymerase sigma factor [Anaerolineales bacterium]|nr:sigma-70 family RNA polymerase sigma factor [Anaerolineales bacterium]MCB8962827.1 sigma-70 family RNA polymerase sigma factor [Ardenticatenales bacterium]MCB0006763.1 sigma-70 family RNA polymerase sigma factor [Anaerolineales bacterium]MCB0010272.1 sigma-70 family RNA polymerase sigma factor [Anaerolineales bacterium]MCB0016770.1 sigma-70 family RNA polymerase sigma factor [Anaerolineales bacterium]
MSDADVDLVQRAQRGDRQAFVSLYDKHYMSVFNFVYYRVMDEPLAQDITAEVFVRLVRDIRKLKSHEKALLGWLYRVARNLIIDHYRRTKRIVDEPEGEAHLIVPDNLPQLIDLAISSLQLQEAFLTLTDEQQQVILLKFVEGYSNREIGERLDKSEGAIKSLQHRALDGLRRVLVKEYGYEAN